LASPLPLPGEAASGATAAVVAPPAALDEELAEASIPRSLACSAAAAEAELPGAGAGSGFGAETVASGAGVEG
jgi:hypothetical protein